jgi:hypothetical protein
LDAAQAFDSWFHEKHQMEIYEAFAKSFTACIPISFHPRHRPGKAVKDSEDENGKTVDRYQQYSCKGDRPAARLPEIAAEICRATRKATKQNRVVNVALPETRLRYHESLNDLVRLSDSEKVSMRITVIHSSLLNSNVTRSSGAAISSLT